MVNKDHIITKDNGTTHRLINSDFLLVEESLPIFDAIITDTPFGTTKCKWDSVVPLEDYIVIEGCRYTQEQYLHFMLTGGINYITCLDRWGKESSKYQ